MAKDFSFDIVSDYDAAQLGNAVDQAQREIGTRYDFKGTAAAIEFGDGKTSLRLTGESRNQLDALVDLLQSKLIKRGLSLKVLDLASEPVASGQVMRWTIALKRGLGQDQAKQLSKLIRDRYPKVKVQIQGEAVRVSSTSKDDLQGVMAAVRAADVDYPLEFENYR